jgi:hypothetical protein
LSEGNHDRVVDVLLLIARGPFALVCVISAIVAVGIPVASKVHPISSPLHVVLLVGCALMPIAAVAARHPTLTWALLTDDDATPQLRPFAGDENRQRVSLLMPVAMLIACILVSIALGTESRTTNEVDANNSVAVEARSTPLPKARPVPAPTGAVLSESSAPPENPFELVELHCGATDDMPSRIDVTTERDLGADKQYWIMRSSADYPERYPQGPQARRRDNPPQLTFDVFTPNCARAYILSVLECDPVGHEDIAAVALKGPNEVLPHVPKDCVIIAEGGLAAVK